MSDVLAQGFVLAGSLLMLLAAIGVTRMPDFYMRLSTVTKGATLGVLLVLTGIVIEMFSPGILIKAAAVVIFGFITSPVSAHMVSRAAYFQGVSLWEGTIVDELRGQYEERRHRLMHPEPEETLAGTILAEGHGPQDDARGRPGIGPEDNTGGSGEEG